MRSIASGCAARASARSTNCNPTKLGPAGRTRTRPLPSHASNPWLSVALNVTLLCTHGGRGCAVLFGGAKGGDPKVDAMSSTCACAQEGSKEWVRAHTFPRESSPHLPIFSPLGVYFLEILPSRDADSPPSPRLRLFTDSAVVQGLHRQPVRGGWVLPRPRLHRILARRAVSPARPQLQAQVRGRPVAMVPRRVAHGRHPLTCSGAS